MLRGLTYQLKSPSPLALEVARWRFRHSAHTQIGASQGVSITRCMKKVWDLKEHCLSHVQFSSLLRGGRFGTSGRKGATSVGKRQPGAFAGIDVFRSPEWSREGLIARIGSPAHLAEMTRINAAWVALTDGERQGCTGREHSSGAGSPAGQGFGSR